MSTSYTHPHGGPLRHHPEPRYHLSAKCQDSSLHFYSSPWLKAQLAVTRYFFPLPLLSSIKGQRDCKTVPADPLR